ncbi:MAG: Oxidoreductase, partial [Tremellales sp. Tagirdzhanova-0007]
MLTHTLRPFTRAVRQLSTRSFYQTPSHSHTTRNATIASLALFAGGGVVYSFRSRPLLADDRVRTSVLDQDSLKQDIHSRPDSDEGQALVEGKQKEAEGSSEGAFNEETGEINWDCPCLGGMADGPCGERFKAAFSCFVFSEAEPKGMDCVDRFKNMQDCFREHPDIYGE